MDRSLPSTLAFAFSLLLASSLAWSQVNFGVALPLTGPRAALGRSIKQGVDLAVAQINQEGGLLGKQVQAVYEDDGGENPEAAVAAVDKLLKQHKAPLVLGPQFDSAHLAVQRHFCGAALLLTASSGSAVTHAGCSSVLRIRANDDAHGRALVSYAIQSLRLYKIGVLHVDDAYGKAGAEAVVRAMRELGLEPVALEKHAVGATDLAPQLGRLGAAGAQLVIAWTHDLEAAVAVRQARQLGLSFRIAGNAAMSQAIFLRRATAQAAQGTVSSTEFVLGNPQPKAVEFQKQFSEAYATEPDLYAAAYYDAARFAARAIAAAGGTDVARVRQAAAGMRHIGVLTTYRCDARGDCNHQIIITEIEVTSPVPKTTMRF